MKQLSSIIDLYSSGAQIADNIGNDLIIVDDISKVPFFEFPYKTDFAVGTICTQGYVDCAINLKNYRIKENDIAVVLPDQVIQYFKISPDFKGVNHVMSQRFIENLELNFKDTLSVFLYLQENPIIHLKPEETEQILDYFNLLRKVMKMKNRHHLQMAGLLIQVFFYGLNDMEALRNTSNIKLSRRDEIFETFYHLILKHYKESREVGFYADKLSITNKYLSVVVSERTGKTPFQWINDYVILEARSLLKFGNMTIQQISDALNFPNQSFFGKYFKQHTGMSPSEYKNK